MTPTQRTAALRLADALELPTAQAEDWLDEAAALLRELAEPVNPAPGYCKHCKQYTIEEPLPAEPVQEHQVAAGMPATCQTQDGCRDHGCHGACLPVQEPVAWIQPDHLQKAQQAPFLCRVEPTKRMSDFIPLYAAPQQRKPLTHMQAVLLWGHRSDGPSSAEIVSFARLIEAAHGIKETP